MSIPELTKTNEVNKYKYTFDLLSMSKRQKTRAEAHAIGIDNPKATWNGKSCLKIINESMAQFIEIDETTICVINATKKNIVATDK